jgi:hypothetical protein
VVGYTALRAFSMDLGGLIYEELGIALVATYLGATADGLRTSLASE